MVARDHMIIKSKRHESDLTSASKERRDFFANRINQRLTYSRARPLSKEVKSGLNEKVHERDHKTF